jgi:peptide/nickel transport system permease protein
VTIILAERLPTTIELSLAALTIAILVGVPLGIISAVRHNSAIDVGTMIGANIGVSMPVFWLGLMLAYLFSVVLGLLPPSGRITAGMEAVPFYEVWGWTVDHSSGTYKVLEFFANLYIFDTLITGQWEVLRDVLTHLILPAVALATIPLAIIARITRAAVLEVTNEDYVRTARAKGLDPSVIDRRHVMKNAMLPVVTVVGLQTGLILTGAVLTETVFAWPGVGSWMLNAIRNADYAVLQGGILFFALITIFSSLLVDISYAFLNPRIRYQ